MDIMPNLKNVRIKMQKDYFNCIFWIMMSEIEAIFLFKLNMKKI